MSISLRAYELPHKSKNQPAPLTEVTNTQRQLTDALGEVTYARGYDPYGVVTYTIGASQTEFGFTGEQYGDSTQLLFLGARYYNPADGRFQSRDTWSGDVNRPLSLNRWMYVEGNPVNFIDPSGHIPCDDKDSACISEKAQRLKFTGESIKYAVRNGYLLPVEGFAQLADLAFI
jgi:RHS repeat-associated protein